MELLNSKTVKLYRCSKVLGDQRKTKTTSHVEVDRKKS
jgi:hypothetical protein